MKKQKKNRTTYECLTFVEYRCNCLFEVVIDRTRSVRSNDSFAFYLFIFFDLVFFFTFHSKDDQSKTAITWSRREYSAFVLFCFFFFFDEKCLSSRNSWDITHKSGFYVKCLSSFFFASFSVAYFFFSFISHFF